MTATVKPPQVDIVGVEGDLKQTALSMLKTRANFAYTIGEVKQDVRRVFNTVNPKSKVQSLSKLLV